MQFHKCKMVEFIKQIIHNSILCDLSIFTRTQKSMTTTTTKLVLQMRTIQAPNNVFYNRFFLSFFCICFLHFYEIYVLFVWLKCFQLWNHVVYGSAIWLWFVSLRLGTSVGIQANQCKIYKRMYVIIHFFLLLVNNQLALSVVA